MTKHLLVTSIIILIFQSCSDNSKTRQYSRINQFKDKNIVATGYAKQEVFYREFESNGKLVAHKKAIIPFESNKLIEMISVINGDHIIEGYEIAKLESVQEELNYERAKRSLAKCKLNLEDVLINMGYQFKDSSNVPKQIMKVALIRSGYEDAIADLKRAKIQLGKTRILAPFNGVIMGLDAKINNFSNEYKNLCTLVDNRMFDVEFPLLESEAFQLKKGTTLSVIPYAFDQDTLSGMFTTINPHVDETGMVATLGVVKNSNERLVDGMNVKVIIREKVGDRVVVPKSAVTLRQERKVVFVCKNDTAHWRYVKIGEENSKFCTIIDGSIKPNEEVVVDGNFNLAHLVPVTKLN
ncbi:efflux RND transporter periplasmic adaptor subunit [Prolixibacteraceae bacterium JC049]|nr:efflux RND transporter periplasmic adaptor subunit [Prolixibacteraceae bacterium JC049]